MKTIDKLLLAIVDEPLSRDFSQNELEFFERLEKLRDNDFGEYLNYYYKYTAIQNSKYLTN